MSFKNYYTPDVPLSGPHRIQSVHVHAVSYPLLKPFVTALGKKEVTHNAQVEVTLAGGVVGYGEASTSIAFANQTQDILMEAMHRLGQELQGQDVREYRRLSQLLWRQESRYPAAAAALECALIDAFSRFQKISMSEFFGGASTQVETDLTLTVAPPDELRRDVAAAWKRGFRRFKVKLAGQSVEQDLQRLQAVCAQAPKAEVVADGNQGFTLAKALLLMRKTKTNGIRLPFFEQPFLRHDLRSMRAFRKRCKVPLVADESVLTLCDALRLFESAACDGINIKIAKSGLLGALDLIQVARRYEKFLSIGCMEESKLGLAASVHLACGTSAFQWIDLDSVFLLKPSSVRGGFSTSGASLSVKGIRAGVGIR